MLCYTQVGTSKRVASRRRIYLVDEIQVDVLSTPVPASIWLRVTATAGSGGSWVTQHHNHLSLESADLFRYEMAKRKAKELSVAEEPRRSSRRISTKEEVEPEKGSEPTPVPTTSKKAKKVTKSEKKEQEVKSEEHDKNEDSVCL